MNLDDKFVNDKEGSVLPLPAYLIIGAFLADTMYRVYNYYKNYQRRETA